MRGSSPIDCQIVVIIELVDPSMGIIKLIELQVS